MGKGKLNPEDLDRDGEGVEGGREEVCGRGSWDAWVVLAILIYIFVNLSFKNIVISCC